MLPRGHYGWVEKCIDQDPEAFMDRRDILPYNQAFIDLIDKENVFDLIVDIMGPNIIFSMSQARFDIVEGRWFDTGTGVKLAQIPHLCPFRITCPALRMQRPSAL